MPLIRTYQDSDKDAMLHIFRETAAPNLRDAGDQVLDCASYLWCRPYLILRPETCLVLDDGTGRAVGYLLGVPDTGSFVRDYQQTYIPYLQSLGFEKPRPDELTGWSEDVLNALRNVMFNPREMLHADHPELLAQWPAHLHIDILPEYQKRGYGRRLIQHFCSMAREEGAAGVHLLMAASNNDQAGRFYERLDFRRFPCVLDGGASGEQGRDQSTIWLVKNIRGQTK